MCGRVFEANISNEPTTSIMKKKRKSTLLWAYELAILCKASSIELELKEL